MPGVPLIKLAILLGEVARDSVAAGETEDQFLTTLKTFRDFLNRKVVSTLHDEATRDVRSELSASVGAGGEAPVPVPDQLGAADRAWLVDQLRKIEDGSRALAATTIEPVRSQGEHALAAVQRCIAVLASAHNSLHAKLSRRLFEFIQRSAPRIRDDTDMAEIRFMLTQPQCCDEGDTLYLDYRVTEKLDYDSDNRDGGSVPGVPFSRHGGV